MDIAEWVEPYRRFWEQQLSSLDRHLKAAKKKKDKARAR
jgi:hypothetical protein